ncbi:Tfp pilus assembly protein, ATPase PilM [Marininema mesophilum]|uniref:Tfp pilus assembly protein, ATPase PilM n=1 Tax=Marininema mesophilum TaxID=1048340 RepID=A0A1H3BP08_9BACL|nr:pilus assembly protein PilM [Marininema mesophilum]SDX42879.1 Tfp pilus assembly protein, ATPase PilM [Marininema mesophilum]
MSLIPKYSMGIELSDSLFKLVEIRQGFRRTHLTQYVAHPLLPVWSGKRELDEREELIQSIQDALLGRRFRTRKVHLSLSNRHVVTGVWYVPEMRAGRMRRWIESKVFSDWELPFDDPIFDFKTIGHVWSDGDQQEVLVVATSRRYVEEMTDLIRWCGLDPVSVGLSSLDLQRWVDFSGETSPHRWATLTISRTGVEVSLFFQGVLQGGSYMPLSMVSCLQDVPDRPTIDPLAPMLTREDQVSSYGKALVGVLKRVEPEWLRKELWQSSRNWMISGEGVDFDLLLLHLQMKDGPSVYLGPSPDDLLSDEMSLKASRWLGNALSVPLGAALTGVSS